MLEILPNALFTRADLIELLQPLGIDADAWISRLHPVKRFRQAWFGEDLLQAIRNAPKLRESDVADMNNGADTVTASKPKRGPRRNSLSASRPSAKLDAYLAELKSSAKQ